MEENGTIGNRPGRKSLFFLIIGAVLVVIVLIIIITGNDDKKLQEQLDLGTKYLEEMEYEQALEAFQKALAIDAENADVYLGIVEVYIRTREFESALEYAKEGDEAIGDERLKQKIDMLENDNVVASNGWLMKTYYYDGDGNLVYWHEYTYN